MAIIKPNNNTISAITALPAAITTGVILQVVTSENDYGQNTTSSSATDILSASGTTWETAITPSATSSKIIIASNLYAYWENNGNSNNRGEIELHYKVGSGSYSELQAGMVGNYDYGGNGVQSRMRHSFHYVVSPSTTSAVTVKFRLSSAGSATGVINESGNSDSNVTLYEVAG
jgi:hypothetical protein